MLLLLIVGIVAGCTSIPDIGCETRAGRSIFDTTTDLCTTPATPQERLAQQEKTKQGNRRFLGAGRERATMYDAETRPRLYSGEPARQGAIVDTSRVNQGPSGGAQNVEYVGSLRPGLAIEPRDVQRDIEELRLAGSQVNPDEKVAINFAGEDLNFFLKQMLGGALGVNFIAADNLGGTVTFRTEEPIPKGEVLAIVRDVLARNGLVLRLINNVYHVAAPDTLTLIERNNSLGRAGDQVTKFYKLQRGEPSEIVKVLRPVLPEGVLLVPVPNTASIMIRGLPEQALQVEGLIKALADTGVGDDKVAILQLHESPPEKVAQQVNELYRAQLEDSGGSDDDDQGGGETQQPKVTVIPLENQQALLVGAKDARLMAGVRELVRRLDRQFRDEPSLRIIPLSNLSADDIADQLNTIFGNGPALPRPPSSQLSPSIESPGRNNSFDIEPSPDPQTGQVQAPAIMRDNSVDTPPAGANLANARRGARVNVGTEGAISIVADDRNNTLLVYSTYSTFQRIREVVRALDVPQAQVVIEATIVEVEINDNLSYGVQWYLAGKGFTARSSTVPQPHTPIKPGFASTISQTIGTVSVDVVLEALQAITRIKVISSPYLTVLDGKKARLVIGDEIPFATTTQQATDQGQVTVTQEIETRDTGIILEVSPKIRANNSVILEVAQEVSKPADTNEEGTLTPTISTRNVRSDIIVQSGRSVLLGGLIQERAFDHENGVPVLRGIPVLGNLFKQNEDQQKRVELMVMITPRVIRQSSQIENLTRMLRYQLNQE